MTVLVVISEGAVGGHAIENRRCIAVSGVDPGLLDVLGIAAAVMPVVGVIADRHDDFVAGDLANRRRNRAGPPLLRGDGTGRAVVGMFVVRHDEKLVGDRSESAKIPRLPNGDGDRHQPAALDEATARFAKQLEIIELSAGIEFLKIEDRARSVVRDQECLELIEQMAPRGRIREQRPDPGRVHLPVREVLYDGEDERPVRSGGDDSTAIPVWQFGELVIGSGDRDPNGREPIEVADVTLERRSRALVPRRIESDIKRFAHRGRDRRRLARSHLARTRRLGTEQDADRAIEPGRRAGKKRQLRRRLRNAMFERDRQRLLRRAYENCCKQRRCNKDVEEDDGEHEPFPATSGWIVENLPINHPVPLNPYGPLRQ